MEHATQVIKIPSSVDEIHHVQTSIHEEMTRQGYDDDTCFAVRLAVEESIVNAVKHGNRFDPTRHVRIRYSITPEKVTIAIKDEGQGFDPAAVPDPTADENLTKPSGRGIMLMRAYMDDVYYSQCGTEVTLVKHKS